MHDSQSVSLPPAGAEYFAAGVPERWRALARVIYSCVAHGRAQYVSTEHLQQRALRAGVHAAWSDAKVSYGTIAHVLELLRATGRLAWQTAHVRRWHADRSPEPGQPRVSHDRLPARCLQLVGIAATVSAFASTPGATALEACSIEALHSRAEAERSESTDPATPRPAHPCFASIEQASSAVAPGVEANALTGAAWREAMRRLWPDG